MRFLSFTAAALLAVLPYASIAHAADSFYVGAKGDIANPSNSSVSGSSTGKVKYGFSSGAGIVGGWQPEALSSDTGDVRFEGEASYHAMKLKNVLANTNPSGDLKAIALMGNAYYDFNTGTGFKPYVGAGVGQGFVKFPKGQGLGNSDSTQNVFAYQAMAGVSYTPESMPQTDWSLGYKYMGFEKPSFSDGAGGHVKLGSLHENAIEAGMRYHF
ncbi:MAG: porin family protein [Rhodospirillales bacterium]|nr:porin family protein [Alphaproteobacteria bacterium]MCB9986381.1 porin family protein [Rhodospirillales bacterium]USO07070.1 MAG: porin family protein [Rhodospirillales bacterium]